MRANPASPSVDEVLAGMLVVQIPMRVRFRGVDLREVALIGGPQGWGEFGAFPEYPVPEAARWLDAAVEAAWVGWPAPVRDQIPVNATVPAVPASQVGAILERFSGCSTAKIKVAEPGQTLSEDLDRVAAVRDRWGPSAALRVDANGAWSVTEAETALAALGRFRLEYAEQPCRTVADLARLRIRLARRGIEVPVAADESVRRASDPMQVARAGAADLLVIKAAPLGGVRSALAIVAETSLPVVVSSALDTSVGIAAGVALAAALPRLRHACGLGTLHLMTDDVVRDPWLPRSGVLRPGTVCVDRDAAARLAAPQSRVRWWRERVRACFEWSAQAR